MKNERNVNDLFEVVFCNMNLAQMLFVQAVLVPEIRYLVDKYSDAILELGDEHD